MDNTTMRALLLILLILYIVSPVDAVPGPLDDLILLIAYATSGD